MKIKHYGVFKNGMEVLDWESLRNDKKEQSYYLPYTKEAYLNKVDTEKPSPVTRRILKEIEEIDVKKLFSIGAGIASQEYQLKKFSKLEIIVSDYNPTVLRLKEFNLFDGAIILDALKDCLPVNESYMVLFPRIDTEFEDNQLSSLFEKCYTAGIKHICIIPAELLTFRIIVAEIKTLLLSIIKRKPRVFCGYARSLGCFRKIWEPYYTLSDRFKTDKNIFFLRAK